MIDIDKEIREAKRKIDQCIDSYSSEGLKDSEGLVLVYEDESRPAKIYYGNKPLKGVKSVFIKIDASTGFRPLLALELINFDVLGETYIESLNRLFLKQVMANYDRKLT